MAAKPICCIFFILSPFLMFGGLVIALFLRFMTIEADF